MPPAAATDSSTTAAATSASALAAHAPAAHAPRTITLAVVALCFFCTGAAGLIYEISWSRTLSLSMGNTSYALATLLTAYMGGLALGAWIGGHARTPPNRALRAYALLEIGVGVFCALLPTLLHAADGLFSVIYRRYYASLVTFNLLQFVVVGGLLILPTTFMGATLPILIRYAVRGDAAVSRTAGLLYAINTLGAFAGALAAGLFLIPTFGLQTSYFAAVAVNLAVGAITLALSRADTQKSAQPPRDAIGQVARDAIGQVATADLGVPEGRSESSPAFSTPGTPCREQPSPVGTAESSRGDNGSDSSPALAKARGLPETDGANVESSPAIDVAPRESRLARATLLVAFALSGFAAMVYQVAWTRATTLAIGSSTYAFTLITGAFILGLALGAFLLSWIGDRRWGRAALGFMPLFIAAGGWLSIGALGDLPIKISRLLVTADDFWSTQWTQFGLVALIFLPPTFFMGGMLPVITRCLAAGGLDAARGVADAYAANTLGTILGSFFGGFILIPWLGMRGSILAAVALSAAVAAVLFVWASRPRLASRLAGISSAVAICVGTWFAVRAAPSWENAVIASGAFLSDRRANTSADAADESKIRQRMLRQNIVFYQEGVSTLVTVVNGADGIRRMRVGGKPDAATVLSTQNWLAHLPLCIHPDARDVLVIGLGGGATAGSAACHDTVRSIDCVEISPEVVDAARRFFADANHHVLDDPRLNLIVGDGRLHLEHTDRTYDVIISQPSNPWIAGAAALFTRECFEAMKQRIRRGGLACIWFQGYAMPAENFRVMSATWSAVWPHVSVWASRENNGEYLFVGSDAPLRVAFDDLARAYAMPRVGEELRRIGIPTPADFMSHLIASDDQSLRSLTPYVEGSRGLDRALVTPAINTDDNARIEFDTPRGMRRDETLAIMRMLHPLRIQPWTAVTPSASPGGDFQTNRQRSAAIFSTHADLLAALALSGPENAQRRGALLADILRRNPLDARARSELSRMRPRRPATAQDAEP